MLPAQLQRQAAQIERMPTGSVGPRPDQGFYEPPLGSHAATHQDGGTDEINVAGLTGLLADAQTPAAHGNEKHSSTFATEGYASAAAVAEVDAHEALSDPHTVYIKHSLATAVSDFLVASGVGAFVKKTLAEVKAILGLGTAAYTASTDYAPAAKGVTNGDSHDHNGGDGAQIAHGNLSDLTAYDHHTQYVRHNLVVAANDFLVANAGATGWIKKTLAEVKTILGLGNAAYQGYATGTWTPTLVGSGGGGPGNTYVWQYGYYTKIGNIVNFNGAVRISAKDPALAGVVRVGGLPFTATNETVNRATFGVLCEQVTYSANCSGFFGHIQDNTAYIQILQQSTNGGAFTALPVGGLGATTIIYFTGQYRITP